MLGAGMAGFLTSLMGPSQRGDPGLAPPVGAADYRETRELGGSVA